MSYLCTITKQPYIEDGKKLKRVMCFMNQTIGDERTIGVNNLHEMQTHVNLSHAMHMDIDLLQLKMPPLISLYGK